MPIRLACAVLSVALVAAVVEAQPDPCQGPDPMVYEGNAPDGPETHFFVPFVVPAGIVEIVVCHDNLSSENILDWGINDPSGFRGWGGGNTEPAIVGVQAASRSYIAGPIQAGTWEVVVGKAFIAETPAPYRIEIFLRREAMLPPQTRSPYADPGVLDDESRWYAGDFHVHSRESGDSMATITENLDVARDTGLDFLMLTEHNTNSGLTLYGDVQPSYPDVLIVPGVEWTTYAGHAIAIGATEWVDHKVGVRGVTVEGAIEAYQEQGALFSPAHPDAPEAPPLFIGGNWAYDVDPASFEGVEAWGNIWNGLDFFESVNGGGSHAAALGGSDDHNAGDANMLTQSPIGSPTTMVFAENLSVAAILEGVRAGRTVVKISGPDAPMLETELSGERIGDTVFGEEATLSVTVTGAGEGDTLLVYKNGAVMSRIPIDADPFLHELEVTAPADGEDRYRHQVSRGTGPKTIGSYVWLRAFQTAPDGGVPDGGMGSGGSSGCSCRVVSSSDGDTGVLLAIVMLGWWRRRRRSLRLVVEAVRRERTHRTA